MPSGNSHYDLFGFDVNHVRYYMSFMIPKSITGAEYRKLMGVPDRAETSVKPLAKVSRMNKTETRYALYLEALLQAGEIDYYRFEGWKLRLADNTFWTPDFVIGTKHATLIDWDWRFVDVKGTRNGKPHVEDDAAVKIKWAAQDYPMFKFSQVWYTANGWQERSF